MNVFKYILIAEASIFTAYTNFSKKLIYGKEVISNPLIAAAFF